MEGHPTAAASAGSVWARGRSLAAAAVIGLAVATVLLRLAPTLSDLSSQTHRNDSWDATARMMAAADSLDIDNGFATAALQVLPQDATFAVATPPPSGTKEIAPLTIEALPGYLRYLMLPRREVAIGDADYVLCYACNTADVPHPVAWIWSSDGGLRIGRLSR